MACPNVEEIPGSRKGNRTKATRRYLVHNADDENDATEAIEAFIPSHIGTLPFLDFNYEESEQVDDQYEFGVEWGFTGNSGDQEIDTTEYRFNYQAAGAKITQSLRTESWHTSIGSSHASAAAVAAPNFNGAINVTKDKDGNRKVEGQDLNPPPEVFTLVYKGDNIVINAAYRLVVQNLVGKVNDDTFAGAAAGTLMLVRVQGARAGGVWTIEFGFAYIPNVTNLDVTNDITVDTKAGMDLVWVYYSIIKDPDGDDFIPYPTAAYVEQVFYRGDFDTLNLPAL